MASSHNNELPEGFKGTELGPLPEEWYVARLGEVASKLKAGGTPSTAEARYWNGNIYFAKVADVARQSKYLTDTAFRITEEGLSHSSAWLVPGGAILLSMYGTAGEATITKKPTAISQNVLGIVPNERVLAEFLYYVLAYAKTETLHLVTDTTIFKHFTLEKAKQIMFPLPTLHEQRAIARVLSAIQKAIDTQDKIIAAVRELKKSLMRHLFTYGPVTVAQAEQVPLKETETGPVPEHWEVVRLGERCKMVMGQSPPSTTYNSIFQGMPFLQGKAEFGFISPKPIKYTTHPLKIAPSKTVLISVRAPVGDVNIADTSYCIGRGLASLSLLDGSNIFLFYLLNYLKPEIEKEGTGSTFKEINKQKLERLTIPFPPVPEQKEIAHIFSTVDEKIEAEEKRKAALQTLFKTMLHLLMTGKVRVKELEALVA